MGAAISYYTIFSIAPLFILLIGLVRLIFDKQTTTLAIARTLTITIGSNLATVIQTLINSAYRSHGGIITTVIGGMILIIAAVSVFSELNSDLDVLWDTAPYKRIRRSTEQTIRNYLKDKLINLSLILIFGVLLLVSVAFTVIASFFQHSLPDILQHGVLVSVIDIAISFIGSSILFWLIYRVLPDTKLPSRELFWGACVTAVFFLIGRFLIGWYISAFGATSAYGAAGSLVGLLLWVYYSAQVFFISASGTFIYSKTYGSLSKESN